MLMYPAGILRSASRTHRAMRLVVGVVRNPAQVVGGADLRARTLPESGMSALASSGGGIAQRSRAIYSLLVLLAVSSGSRSPEPSSRTAVRK
jgi:hypothetical protein